MEQVMESAKEQFYQRRIAELESENAQLRQENIQLRSQVKNLTQQVITLTKQIAVLTEQVARLSKNSSNSSKPPSSDIVKPPKPKSPKGPRKQGGQPGHKGVNRPPFQREQIKHFENLHPDGCPHCCGSNLKATGKTKVQHVAELREDPIFITEYRVYQSFCQTCGKKVWGKYPHGVVEGQLFGLRLQSLIAYMKGSLHASYTGMENFCSEILGINVSRSHLCNTTARVSESLSKPYEELARYIPTEKVLNIDESSWKDKGDLRWIWVFCTSLVSFFCIAQTRSAKVLKKVLGEVYAGTIVSDFFGAYTKYSNRLQQFCLAHLIRDIKFLTTLPDEFDKRFGERLLIDFKRLFHFWHLREKIPKDRFERIMFRIRNRVLSLADEYSGGERSKSRTLARRFVKHGEAIFYFLLDTSVSPTNNAAERSIRTAVIDRHITQGSRSEMGQRWSERIWTTLDTCRKQKRSAWQFLQDALSAHYFQTPTPSLIPHLTT